MSAWGVCEKRGCSLCVGRSVCVEKSGVYMMVQEKWVSGVCVCGVKMCACVDKNCG